ncbi:MAG: site-specific integrase [Rikenellaceae bacterium]
MAKITKSLSSKVRKEDSKVEIMLRFIGGRGAVLRAKSNIFIKPDRWNVKNGEFKTAQVYPDMKIPKKQLTDLCTKIIEEFGNIPKEQATKEWLAEVVERFHHPEKFTTQEEDVKPTFFELFEEFLQVHQLSEVRKRNFRVIYRALQRYETYKGITLDIDTATDATLRDIDKFLRDEHTLCEKPKYIKILKEIPESRTPQPRGQNTINDIFTKIRTFWLWCIKEGKTTNRPEMKIAECEYGTPFYINIEERKRIERTNLNRHPQLAIQRDVFVFQCLIGCRVGDLYKFTPQNVVDGAIEYVPRKTKKGNPITVSVPLSNTAKDILSRYQDPNRTKLLPYISEQKYNVAIKRIFRAARINRVVQVRNPLTGDSEPRPLYEVASSHLARRTFVGNIYKRVKDPNLVGSLSGHKEGSKAFSRYRDIDKEMKQEMIDFLD